MVMTIAPKPEDVRTLLTEAEERLESAGVLLEAGNYRDAVQGRITDSSTRRGLCC